MKPKVSIMARIKGLWESSHLSKSGDAVKVRVFEEAMKCTRNPRRSYAMSIHSVDVGL